MQKNVSGFTLIELLTVIAIISTLANIGISSTYVARQKARDVERISTVKTLQRALEAYYLDHSKYPSAGGIGFNGWTYKYPLADGSGCTALQFNGADLRTDNSASIGFIDDLYPEYFSKSDWTDPLNVDEAYSSIFNCKYIVLTSETDPAGDGIGLGNDDDSNVQQYAIHCGLESSFEYSQNDGGFNSTLFEVQMPTKWLCVEQP